MYEPEGSDVDCSFYVGRVPEAVFSTHPEETLRPEFEAVFRVYGEGVRFDYLRSFGRVRVTYPSPEQTELAQASLHGHEFQGASLRLQPIKPFILGSQRLGIPQKTHQFLLSPPASPPLGWEQSQEQAPCIDYSLVTALASLHLPGAAHEVHGGSQSTPSIVVVTPDDDEEMDLTPSVLRGAEERQSPSVRLTSLPAELRHTARPPQRPGRSSQN